jgi:hypothetical protein
LRKLPKFAEWLHQEVEAAMHTLDKPTDDEFEESRLPEKVATAYQAMYVHGMHLRIRSAKEEKVTTDSGIAATVWRRNRGREVNRSEHLETAEYVGCIEEILELNDRSHCCIVLVCSLISGNMTATNAKVICDEYGFTLGNSINTMPLCQDSFAFPTQCI